MTAMGQNRKQPIHNASFRSAPKADLLTSARSLLHTPRFRPHAKTEPSFLRHPGVAETLEIGGLIGPDQFADSICVAGIDPTLISTLRLSERAVAADDAAGTTQHLSEIGRAEMPICRPHWAQSKPPPLYHHLRFFRRVV